MSRRSPPPAPPRSTARAAADRDRQYLPRAAVGQAAGPGRGHQRLQPDQICRRAQRPGRRRPGRQARAARQGAADAQRDGRHLRPQHRLDADAQPRDARAAHDPRRRKRREDLRIPPRPSQGRKGRLSRLPRSRIAPGRHLPAPLHRRGIDLLALSEGRRARGLRLPRRAQDRQSGGQPRRDRDACLGARRR